MKLTWDESKRLATLEQRGLDFARAGDVFDGAVFTQTDEREDYGEVRNISVGRLESRMVVVVWTPRHGARHIISMRKANDREQKRFEAALEQG